MASTYHCLCAELILASRAPLSALPKRAKDSAIICEISDYKPQSGTLTDSVSFESSPVMLKLEDGFEKRYPAKCRRCNLTIGYQLDLSQYEERKTETGKNDHVLYIIPGGLIETEDMKQGKLPSGKEVEIPGAA